MTGRAGRAQRPELAGAITVDVTGQVAAVGSAVEIAARIAAYRRAGADHVAVAPSTDER